MRSLPIRVCCFATKSASAWRRLVVNELYALIPDIKRRGIGILIVEQDIERSLAVADRFYCLLEGKVTLADRPGNVTRDVVMQHYFGL